MAVALSGLEPSGGPNPGYHMAGISARAPYLLDQKSSANYVTRESAQRALACHSHFPIIARIPGLDQEA